MQTWLIEIQGRDARPFGRTTSALSRHQARVVERQSDGIESYSVAIGKRGAPGDVSRSVSGRC